MVTFSEFTNFSNQPVTEDDFPFLEARAVDILTALCGQTWSPSDAICKRAVMYQVEYVLQLGGLTEWQNGKGAMASHSYTVGGESESITYMQAQAGNSGTRVFNGLAVSPVAWALLRSNGKLVTVRRVKTW